MSQSAWTDLSPTLGHPSSHRQPLLAVAALLFRWLPRCRHQEGVVWTLVNLCIFIQYMRQTIIMKYISTIPTTLTLTVHIKILNLQCQEMFWFKPFL